MTRRQRASAWAVRLVDKLAIREFWMFTIAALGLGIVGFLCIQVAVYGIPPRADAIVGGAVTGILMRVGDVINAIRALWRVSQEAEEPRNVE